MTLAIVIPTQNEEEQLPRLLHSLQKQTLQPDEIIVADADSTDSTVKVAESFGARVVEGGLPGPGRNRGADATKSELIFFLDADVDLVESDFLEKAVAEFELLNLDIATCDVLPIGGTKYDLFSHKVYNKYVRLLGRFHAHAPGFCILVKKELHEKLKGFDKTVIFCEDHDYAARGNKIGNFGFLNSVRIHVSTRRQERDGRFTMGVKYILAEIHILIFGPIRHNAFNYTFGYEKKEDYAREESTI